LAETFAIFTPNKSSLILHLKIEEEKTQENTDEIVKFYQQNNEMDPDIIREMIEVKPSREMMDEITRLD